jgi:hypothetical protein
MPGVKKGIAQAQAQVGGLRASIVKNAGLIKAQGLREPPSRRA